MYAPIALFVYSRPQHSKRVVEALQKNILAKESEIYIFSDGARNNKDQSLVDEIRKYLRTVTGFKKIEIIEKKQNDGLAKSITDGVTNLVEKFGKIIVLEDDIVTSPYFLNFMNDALDLYQNEPKVLHINGYFFRGGDALPETFFYNQALCWGWATWKRAWDKMSKNNLKDDLDALIKGMQNQDQSKMYVKNALSQLVANKKGTLHTWAARWQAVISIHDGFCLTPKISFTLNIGHDGSGEHSNISDFFETKLATQYQKPELIEIVESTQAVRLGNDLLKKVRGSIMKRILYRLGY